MKNRTVTWAAAGCIGAALLLTTGCSGGDAVVTVNQGICNDLDAGATPFQIWRSIEKYGYTPEKFAHKLDDATLVVCTDHRADADVQALLKNWNLA